MRRILLASSIALACVAGSSAAPPPVAVIVELFTSEGCSSCPPADVLLERLSSEKPGAVEIIGLGQHVDYWDQLGWKDRFSSSALTNRQRLYASRFNNDSIYTPQMVVDGRSEFVGTDASAARKAIDRAIAAPHGVVRIAIERGVVTRPALHVTVTASDLPQIGRGDRADIIVAITEDHLRSDVKRGENHGRTLTHAAVVRHMVTAGEAAPDGVSSARMEIPVAADWRRDNLRIVAFVQERRGRTILASAALPLQTVQR